MGPLTWGIVLAAGRSRRMGQPKALLPAAGATFLRRAVRALHDGGCAGVTVAVRPPVDSDTDRIAAEARAVGARVVEVSPDNVEQIHSLRTALRSLDPEPDAVVVMPVDLPRAGGPVVAALREAFRRSPGPVVVPVHDGRHGHPVLFARSVFPELLRDPLPEGARSVVHAHRDRLVEVPVDAAGVLLDVDTPADYRLIVGGEK